MLLGDQIKADAINGHAAYIGMKRNILRDLDIAG
jgi:hypothetical protein